MNRYFDPILVEVLKHELSAVAEEMAIAVSKTARSAMVKSGDFAIALCDAEGRVIGPAYAAPMQLVAFVETMASITKTFKGDFHPGDVILVNDPYSGMGHMPDVAVAAPVFWNDQLVAFAISYSHHMDVGGRFAGGMSSQARTTFEEGVRVPPVKLVSRRARNEALLQTILANVRTPEEWLGDVEAKIAGCWRGEQELRALLDKYGVEAFHSCRDYLLDHSETAVRNAIRAIPDGRYEFEDVFEEDGFGNAAATKLKVALIVEGDAMTVDFTGTDPQVESAVNMPISMTKGMLFAALKMVVGRSVFLNAGFLRPFDVIIPEGSILNPRFPAAVGGRAPVLFRVSEIVTRALAKALPEEVPVPGEGADVMHYTGHRGDGRAFTAMDVYFGGWGGRPRLDGIDGATPVMFGSYGTISAEMLERDLPIVVEGFGYVPDSGGAGKHRGSLAIFRQWRFLEPGHVMVRTNRPTRKSDGLAGAEPGALSVNRFWSGGKEMELPKQTHFHLEVKAGDRLYHAIGGSGGHGDPWARDPKLVLADVLDEKLSVALARTQFGVVIDPKHLTINDTETRAVRKQHAAA